MTDDQSTQHPAGSGPDRGPEWERKLLRDLAFAALKEQRRARRWGILFKSLILAYLVVVLVLFANRTDVPVHGPHTARVDLTGVIMEDSLANADRVIGALRDAFESEQVEGVILRANSPGGSAVQGRYVYEEIRRLREQNPQTPVYAVITDVCASACYYVAAAADRIYASGSSLVGSIGVLYDGFGYPQLMDKLGVERRLLTAGENKGMMDPFSPLNDEAVEHFQGILDQAHGQFVEAVKDARGSKLASDADLFSGLVWTGARGVELGLVDGLASVDEVAREVVGQEEIIDYTRSEKLLDRISRRVGASIAQHLLPLNGIGLSPLR